MSNSINLDGMTKIVDSYVACWKNGNNNLISPTPPQLGISNPNIILSNNLTLCEKQYLLFIKFDDNCGVWRKKIDITYLPYNDLLHLPFLLTRSLRAQTVNYDHRVLWSWIAQTLSYIQQHNHNVLPNTINDDEFLEAFYLLVRLELISLSKPPSTGDIRKLNNVLDILVNYDFKEIINKKYLLALLLSFPTLERLTKLKCSNYVNLEGKVIKEFNGLKKTYKIENRVSSLADLLYLVETKVNANTKDVLEQFRSELNDIFNFNDNAYKLIYKWRSNLLHGSKPTQIYHAVILNLISLYILDSLAPVYDSLKEPTKKMIQNNVLMPEMRWNKFYPPDLF